MMKAKKTNHDLTDCTPGMYVRAYHKTWNAIREIIKDEEEK
jgi:hypothetical protein